MEFNIKMSGLQISQLCLEQCYFPAFYIFLRCQAQIQRKQNARARVGKGIWGMVFFFQREKCIHLILL